ncbi:hypothetical protein FRY74_09955 [Vicingus serpentipes]|uniref:Glycosyltransferase RgtA/B/C/D-like domain-containing protein n=1 Tax=Vicingus serpentipes TaxID=1926625 RepID=A0A5C6RS48_9FLAO|nr:hypothetical protein [Vicingus serpentipes]TXB64765.1 hypothetical protein FRY74_09955 [Vicingus serpentipes]
MSILKKSFNFLIVLLLAIVFCFYSLSLGESILDPGDGLKHFLIAKHSWDYPALFFDHWGKPLFTLLSSPFAQFGFKGMLFFNTLLFVVTSFFLLKIAKLFSLKNGWLAILFCFSIPIYFGVVVSGLTEILLATLIVAALYYFLKENYFTGCIILSFSYFSRPESLFVIMSFVLYLLVIKKYKYIPIIGLSIIIYSIAGSFTHDDFFWVFTKRPYSSTGTYGSGELFHFVGSYKDTFGKYISFSFLVGISVISYNFIKTKLTPSNLQWNLLVVFPVFLVVGAHSILWWKGMQGSAGLLRILATIAPLVALVAVFALNKIESLLPIKTLSKPFSFLLLIVGSYTAYLTVQNHFVDDRMISSEKVLLEAAEWYKNEHKGVKIYYMPPYFAYQAGIDPFGKDTNMEMFKMFKDKKNPSNNVEFGELILWDGQFSEIEGKISLTTMYNDPSLSHVKTFKPEKSFKVYGINYEVQVFKKVKNKLQQEVNKIIERIKNNKEWFDKVKVEAENRGVSIEEMLKRSAIHVIKNRK